jgi:hypothetical protein
MSGIMMQLLGAAGASLGWYFVYDPHPYDVEEDISFNDVVVASDDTIIAAGNQNNTKVFLISFNTNGAVQNTRQFSNSTYIPRQENGPSLDINSSDKISLAFVQQQYDVSANRRVACTVLNKDLTTAMSTSNRMTWAGNRNISSDGDTVFVRTALGDDNRMYWTTSYTDNNLPAYRIAQNKTDSTEGFTAYQAQGSSDPAMVTIANDKLAVCYAPDQNNTGSSRIGVIDADYGSTASGDQNLIWKANMDFGNSIANSNRINDIAYDGSTYLYAVADNGQWSTSADTAKSVGIIKVTASNGTLQWQKKYRLNSLTGLNGNSGYLNQLSCALDSDGNLFFIGEASATQLVAGTEYVVFGKILANGDFSWCHQLKFDSATSIQSGQTFSRRTVNSGKQKNGIACDSTGAVYIATTAKEYVSDTSKKERPFLIKVNNDGTTIGDFGDFVISEANSVTNETTGLQYNISSAGSGDRFLYHAPASSGYNTYTHATNSTTTSIGSTDYQLNNL